MSDESLQWGYIQPPCSHHRSLIITHYSSLITHHFLIQPGLRRAPITAHSHRRNRQHLGGLFQTQAAKVTQLHHTALTRVEFREFIERFIESQQLPGALVRHERGFFQRHLSHIAPMFGVMPASSVVYKDVPHDLRYHCKK